MIESRKYQSPKVQKSVYFLTFIIIALILILIAYIAPSKQSEIQGLAVISTVSSGNLTLQPSSTKLALGSQLRIDIVANGFSDLTGVQIDISYNSNVLKFDRAEEGDYLSKGGAQTLFLNTIGVMQDLVKDIVIVRLGAGASGSGVIASLYFDAVHSGTSEIKFANYKLADSNTNSISTKLINATVIVLTSADASAPIISNIGTTSITARSAIIFWNTDEASSSEVEYGTSKSLGLAQSNSSFVTSHYITLENLQPKTLYYYRIKSKDANDKSAISGIGNFTTISLLGTSPKLLIIRPLNEQVIRNSTIELKYTKSGNLIGVSHAHFQLDSNAEVIDVDFDGSYIFTDVSAGIHSIIGYLVNAAHEKIDATSTQVSFTVISASDSDQDSDNDGIPDLLDYCPSTLTKNINKNGCPLPKRTKFADDLTTNFSLVNLRSVQNLRIGIANVGQIDFGNNIIDLVFNNTKPVDLDDLIEILPNRAIVKSHLFNNLNKSAIIILNLANIVNPLIQKDGNTCNDCRILSFANSQLTFQVKHFTEYSVTEGSYCGDSYCSSQESCSVCSNDCGVCLQSDSSSPSGGGGGGGSGGGGSGIAGSVFMVCNMDWQCGAWSECVASKQTRTCNFIKVPQHAQDFPCVTVNDMPNTEQSCVEDAIKQQDLESKLQETVAEKQDEFAAEEQDRALNQEKIEDRSNRLSSALIVMAVTFVIIVVIGAGVYEIKSIKTTKYTDHIKAKYDALLVYIRLMRSRGRSDEEIASLLAKAGWNQNTIRSIMKKT